MIPFKLYVYAAIAALFLVSNLATGIWQHHEGTLAGNAALMHYKASQSLAVAEAAGAAQLAQQQADAGELAQQKAALLAAQVAVAQREAVMAEQAKRVQALEASLHAIPSTDKAAATWLGPLPPSIQQALNPPAGDP